MSDPTQEGGQEIKPTGNARNAVLAQIAQQAHQNVSDELSTFNEDTGEIGSAPQDAPAPAQEVAEVKPAEEAKPAEQPQKKVVSIVVDGQTIEVDEDKIIEAGKRTLQKESAADRRLQEAARLKQQAEALLNQAQQGRNESPPSQDAAQTAQAINGFTPETLTTLVQGLRTEVTKEVMTSLSAQEAVSKFRQEFVDIAQDPDLWLIAVKKNQDRLDHAMAVGAPPGDDLDAYRKIGAEIRAKFQPPKAVEVPQDKADRKRTITAIPAVNAKAPTPQEQKPKTLSEQIEEMRRKRTQGYRTLAKL